MIIHAGVEIRPRAIDHDLMHQPGAAKGAQRVVNRGQTDPLATGRGQREQAFGGDMTVFAVADQQTRQSHALSCRAQPALGQPNRTALHILLIHHDFQPASGSTMRATPMGSVPYTAAQPA